MTIQIHPYDLPFLLFKLETVFLVFRTSDVILTTLIHFTNSIDFSTCALQNYSRGLRWNVYQSYLSWTALIIILWNIHLSVRKIPNDIFLHKLVYFLYSILRFLKRALSRCFTSDFCLLIFFFDLIIGNSSRATNYHSEFKI